MLLIFCYIIGNNFLNKTITLNTNLSLANIGDINTETAKTLLFDKNQEQAEKKEFEINWSASFYTET